MPPQDERGSRVEASTPDVGFVACIEGGVLEAQALLLFESIRLYGGRFADCAAYAFSPRRGHAISREARKRLDELGVRYVDAVLNTERTEYGAINRIVAGAYAEERCDHEILVVLDSDTLFLREPCEILLPPGLDVAVRPVDLKGMCTEGPDDPFDTYWRELCRCCGVDYDQIPWGESFVDHRRIKACYNAGLSITRREAGVLRRCSDFFYASVRRGLVPHPKGRRFRAGAGWVNSGTSRLWGSSQAALSLAIWGSTRRVRQLPPTYNYPLTLHGRVDPEVMHATLPQLVHVHYHWLLEESPSVNPLFHEPAALTPDQRAWLGSAGARVQSAAAGSRPLRKLLRRVFSLL
jgi:hypothetical protein